MPAGVGARGVLSYRDGYRYQVAADLIVPLPAPFQPYVTAPRLPDPVDLFFLVLPSCALAIFRGYAWDGASFFLAIETRATIRGTLFHDVGYQAIRLGILPPECRHLVDLLFYLTLREDGVSPLRARAWYRMVRTFAASAALPTAERPILTAP